MDTAKKYSKRPKAVKNYLELAFKRIRKCDKTLEKLLEVSPDSPRTARLKRASAMAHKLLDQVARRLVQDEKIPPEEKIYSLHAPYTRWIKKGKHGSKEVELGGPVSIVESTSRLIMMWKILWTGEDVDVAVDLARECVESYPNVISMSFDWGFSSAENIEGLDTILDHVVMPKRGTLKQADQLSGTAWWGSDPNQRGKRDLPVRWAPPWSLPIYVGLGMC